MSHLHITITFPGEAPLVCLIHGSGGLMPANTPLDRVLHLQEIGEPTLCYLAYHARGSIPARIDLRGGLIELASEADRARFAERSMKHRHSIDQWRSPVDGELDLLTARCMAAALDADDADALRHWVSIAAAASGEGPS